MLKMSSVHWVLLLTLVVATLHSSEATTKFFLNQPIVADLGASLDAPPNDNSAPSTLSYVISVTNVTQQPTDPLEPTSLTARFFLGNSLFAGPPVVWTPENLVGGNWMNLHAYISIDPCRGLQLPQNPAWLILDTLNVSLVTTVAVAANPLGVLVDRTSFNGDSSHCIDPMTPPLEGAPAQCDQYFVFDFSKAAPPSIAGYTWGFVLQSTNGQALPFSKAIVAGGPSCPSNSSSNQESWNDIILDPRGPGNSPSRMVISNLTVGTHIQKWWIQLKVPNDAPNVGSVPFTIQALYDVILPPLAPPGEVPSAPSTSPTPVSPAPAPEEPSPPPPPPKEIPIWAIVLICVICIGVAAGAMFWVWRATRDKPKDGMAYEIY